MLSVISPGFSDSRLKELTRSLLSEKWGKERRGLFIERLGPGCYATARALGLFIYADKESKNI